MGEFRADARDDVDAGFIEPPEQIVTEQHSRAKKFKNNVGNDDKVNLKLLLSGLSNTATTVLVNKNKLDTDRNTEQWAAEQGNKLGISDVKRGLKRNDWLKSVIGPSLEYRTVQLKTLENNIKELAVKDLSLVDGMAEMSENDLLVKRQAELKERLEPFKDDPEAQKTIETAYADNTKELFREHAKQRSAFVAKAGQAEYQRSIHTAASVLTQRVRNAAGDATEIERVYGDFLQTIDKPAFKGMSEEAKDEGLTNAIKRDMEEGNLGLYRVVKARGRMDSMGIKHQKRVVQAMTKFNRRTKADLDMGIQSLTELTGTPKYELELTKVRAGLAARTTDTPEHKDMMTSLNASVYGSSVKEANKSKELRMAESRVKYEKAVLESMSKSSTSTIKRVVTKSDGTTVNMADKVKIKNDVNKLQEFINEPFSADIDDLTRQKLMLQKIKAAGTRLKLITDNTKTNIKSAADAVKEDAVLVELYNFVDDKELFKSTMARLSTEAKTSPEDVKDEIMKAMLKMKRLNEEHIAKTRKVKVAKTDIVDYAETLATGSRSEIISATSNVSNKVRESGSLLNDLTLLSAKSGVDLDAWDGKEVSMTKGLDLMYKNPHLAKAMFNAQPSKNSTNELFKGYAKLIESRVGQLWSLSDRDAQDYGQLTTNGAAHVKVLSDKLDNYKLELLDALGKDGFDTVKTIVLGVRGNMLPKEIIGNIQNLKNSVGEIPSTYRNKDDAGTQLSKREKIINFLNYSSTGKQRYGVEQKSYEPNDMREAEEVLIWASKHASGDNEIKALAERVMFSKSGRLNGLLIKNGTELNNIAIDKLSPSNRKTKSGDVIGKLAKTNMYSLQTILNNSTVFKEIAMDYFGLTASDKIGYTFKNQILKSVTLVNNANTGEKEVQILGVGRSGPLTMPLSFVKTLANHSTIERIRQETHDIIRGKSNGRVRRRHNPRGGAGT